MREQFKTADAPLTKSVKPLMEYDLVKIIAAIRNGELELPEEYKK